MYLLIALVVIVFTLLKEAWQRAQAEAFAEKYTYNFGTGEYTRRD